MWNESGVPVQTQAAAAPYGESVVVSAAADSVVPGRLLVISGPSGVGKTTVCERLLKHLPTAVLSVSVTTRPPRPGERDGVDYWFVSADDFEKRVREGGFLEHAEYQGHRYGTPAEPVRRSRAKGRIVVLEIDVQGGLQVCKTMPESIRVFLLPPSDEVLRARLTGRGTEAADVQKRRLEAARKEIELAHSRGAYPHKVVNNDVDRTVEAILEIIGKENRSE